MATTSRIGATFEVHARAFLERQQLRFIARNITTRGGEIDLVMQDPDGTLVFVEVRARTHGRYGNAVTSIDQHKRQRIVLAAQQFWAEQGGDCACRFDVVAFDGGQLTWLRDAFQADDA